MKPLIQNTFSVDTEFRIIDVIDLTVFEQRVDFFDQFIPEVLLLLRPYQDRSFFPAERQHDKIKICILRSESSVCRKRLFLSYPILIINRTKWVVSTSAVLLINSLSSNVANGVPFVPGPFGPVQTLFSANADPPPREARYKNTPDQDPPNRKTKQEHQSGLRTICHKPSWACHRLRAG